ncbi:MAG: tripartite tricarboxylate transporter substrate binding protein [Betaproteobacteria bacterium]|nr:tripartite tricarboxylate transporter substrate binding protein [Betaproteobacteria bacterium]
MRRKRMSTAIRLFAVLAAAAAAAASTHAQAADSFPTRPVRWIVPVSPAGTTDIMSRLIGARLHELWSQQVIIDNRPGGAFVTGTDILAKASPDGHTIGMLLSPHAVNPFVMKKLPYDSVKDFQPITLVAIVPGLLTMHPGVPAKNLKDIIALAKAKPGSLNYGSPAPMTSGHLSMELLKLMTGIEITHIPYKGGAPAMAAVMAGESHMMISGPATVQANVKAGKLKAIAVTTAKRSPGMPDVPTFQESGVPGFDTYEWYGLFAPAGIPRSTLQKLNRDIGSVVRIPEVSARLNSMGCIPTTNSPQEFAAFVKSEMQKWGSLAKKVNLQPN